jgi:reverse transcriptase-like protein
MTFTASEMNGLFLLDKWGQQVTALAAYTLSDPWLKFWHLRLCHLGEGNIKKLKTMTTGMEMPAGCLCWDCVRGRMRPKAHKRPFTRGKYRNEFIHIDIQVYPIAGYDGAKYSGAILDDYTQYGTVQALKRKDELTRMVSQYLATHTTPERPCRRMRLDQAGETRDELFINWARDRGATLELTATDQHEQNGCIEVFHRIILDKLSPTMRSAGLDMKFWSAVLPSIGYIRNISPSSTLGDMTPYEAWHGHKPDLSHLRPIGTPGLLLTPQKRKKSKLILDKGDPVKLIGYSETTTAIWKVLNRNNQIVLASDVIFDEVKPHIDCPCDPETENQGTTVETVMDQPGNNQKVMDLLRTTSTPASMMDQYRTMGAKRQMTSKQARMGEKPQMTAESWLPEFPPQGYPEVQSQHENVTSATSVPPLALEELDTVGNELQEHDESFPASQPCSNPVVPVQQVPTSTQPTTVSENPLGRVSSRSTKGQPPSRYGMTPLPNQYALAAALLAVPGTEPYEPKSLKEAQRDPNWEMWKAGLGREMESLEENKTWIITPLPEEKNLLRGKWVFRLKRGPDGSVVKWKARWVVRGFTQIEGIDYFETFASVVKPMSYKALFAIAAAYDLEIEQMDVTTAFLYGDIDTEVYVEQPHGYEDGTGRACLLKKALYSLKQSPRIWYQTLSSFLRGLGFEPLAVDMGVFHKGNYFIAVYVDDLLIIGPDKKEIQIIKDALSNRFKMVDIGPCKYYLGMEIHRDRPNRTLRLSQKGYIDRVLFEFGMQDCKPLGIPMDPKVRLESAPEDYIPAQEDKEWYARLVGSLMYIMLGTRADIAFTVSALSRYLAKPTDQHLLAAKRVLRYLRGSSDLVLVYRGDLRPLIGYTDADWGGDMDTRRSTSGYLFNIGSGAISWSSKRQPTVALSSCEAEYMGETQATKEAIWLRNLLTELNSHRKETQATIIYGDNQGAIALAQNPQFHARTKHIDIQHHFVRENQDKGLVDIQYISTDNQIADGLTKALPKDAFHRFRKSLGLETYTTGF